MNDLIVAETKALLISGLKWIKTVLNFRFINLYNGSNVPTVGIGGESKLFYLVSISFSSNNL